MNSTRDFVKQTGVIVITVANGVEVDYVLYFLSFDTSYFFVRTPWSEI